MSLDVRLQIPQTIQCQNCGYHQPLRLDGVISSGAGLEPDDGDHADVDRTDAPPATPAAPRPPVQNGARVHNGAAVAGNGAPISGTKICRGCAKRLRLDQFTSHAGLADGLEPRCRRCRTAQRRAIPEQYIERLVDMGVVDIYGKWVSDKVSR